MVGRTMFATMLAAGLLMAGRPARAELARGHDAPPGIRIWTNHGDVYRDGEPVQVFFRTENDAYVTILRVETGGLVRVLFPRSPDDPNLAHGGETYVVPGIDDRDAFYVDDAPGIGYVFGVASADPFSYDAFEASDHWSFQDINDLSDGRIHGDPYASLQDLVGHIMPPGYADYDTHLLPYYVNQHYDYPRFLCYDCHAYTPYAYWDPYGAWCPRFSLAVFYNPFYFYPSYWYPTRYYRGTNVVYVRPGLNRSQYVFRSRGAQASPYVVYRDRRDGGDGRGGGVRGADIGGVGSIPAPGGRRTVGGGDVMPGGRRAVGGGAVAQGEGRRAVGGGFAQPPAAATAGRRFIGEPRATGASPRVIGPDQAPPAREAAPSRDATPTPSRRGIYLDPGMRTPSTPTTASSGSQRTSPRYIAPQAQPQQEQPRAAPSYAPRSTPEYAPRSAPGYAPRPSPAPAPRAEPGRSNPGPAVGRSPAPSSRPASPSLERRRR